MKIHAKKQGMLLAAMVLLIAGCSTKQESRPLPIDGEASKAGAKLAYEHHLRIELPSAQIAQRIMVLREACESARFGACNVLRIDQGQDSGSLTVRIVPAGVEPITRMASQDGKLASRETTAEDLAGAIDDNARKQKQLEAYSAQVEQLAQRKDLAVGDLIALSHERAQIQVQREELANTAAQQQMRVDTNLLELDFSDVQSGHRLGIALSDLVDQLDDGIRDALSMVAYGAPFLLLLPPVFLLALGWRWLWRRLTRKSRERDGR